MEREAGILMQVSSLPGRHGIGDFGSNAFAFVDMMTEAGLKIWQILPLGYVNSPYQPYSSFAGDELYISLDRLQEEGLLGKTPAYDKFSTSVDYQGVREFKNVWLKKAYRNFVPNQEYEEFTAQSWVRAYAIFLTFKKHNDLVCWTEWPQKQKDYWKIPATCPTAIEGSWIEAPGYDFFDTLFVQYPDINIIVEDQGDLRPEVQELRDHYDFKGMKVLQFAFDPLETNNDFPDRTSFVC